MTGLGCVFITKISVQRVVRSPAQGLLSGDILDICHICHICHIRDICHICDIRDRCDICHICGRMQRVPCTRTPPIHLSIITTYT